MTIENKAYGKTQDGNPVDLYTLTNDNGMVVTITNYGGIITSVNVPNKNGQLQEVVLGYDTLEEYLKNPYFFGCIVGRFANRIRNAKFTLDGQEHQLDKNIGEHHIHGGKTGFHTAVWKASTLKSEKKVSLTLTHTSPDGHENYPGNLDCTVIYSLTNDNAIEIEYKATTDKATIVNLTNHSYFNLKDEGKSDILDHILKIDADEFTIKEDNIPNGEMGTVENTALDFRNPVSIGDNMTKGGDEFKMGFDNNFVLNKNEGELKSIARAYSEVSGITMDVLTTTPGVQLYTAGYINNEPGAGGKVYNAFHAFCLETQYYPDAPNIPHFPSTTLRPGEELNETTVYKFGVI